MTVLLPSNFEVTGPTGMSSKYPQCGDDDEHWTSRAHRPSSIVHRKCESALNILKGGSTKSRKCHMRPIVGAMNDVRSQKGGLAEYNKFQDSPRR